jgi:hypothetical protein
MRVRLLRRSVVWRPTYDWLMGKASGYELLNIFAAISTRASKALVMGTMNSPLHQEGEQSVETLNKSAEQQSDTLNAVYDDDLMGVLEELGVAKDFEHGRLKCAFCGDTITWNNLHSLFPDSGAIKFSCDKAECVNQLIAKVEAQSIG